MTRTACLLWLGCLGCQGFGPGVPPAPPLKTPEPVVAAGPAAAGAKDPLPADRHLVLAAALLDQGRERDAVVQLKKYIAKEPGELLVRAELGELLFRLHEWDQSRLEFELFIACAQDHAGEAFRYLIHSHSRLVEIAEQAEDEYQEHLNRGIGLYLLAQRRATEPDPEGACSASSLLCRAAEELQEARRAQPQEARPHLYLARVWGALGQQAAADRSLLDADARALLSSLTPAERRDLSLACLRRHTTESLGVR
jgi:hypothetical protein